MYLIPRYVSVPIQGWTPTYVCRIEKRRIWTSVTSATKLQAFTDKYEEIKKAVPKYCYLNLTDFGAGSIADLVHQIKFAKSIEGFNFKDCNLIVNVANSGDDWKRRFAAIQETLDGYEPHAIMLVKGSGGIALSQNPDDQEKLRKRYVDMCKTVKAEGYQLALVADITGHSRLVEDTLRYKFEGLGASIINTHPIVDPSMVTQETRVMMAQMLLKSFGANDQQIRFIMGQLVHTQTLYQDYSRDESGAKVAKYGKDLYPISDEMRQCAQSNGWDSVTEIGMFGTAKILEQVAPTQPLLKSIQSRVGLGVPTDDLQKLHRIGTIIEQKDTDITDEIAQLASQSMSKGMTDEQYMRARPKDGKS